MGYDVVGLTALLCTAAEQRACLTLATVAALIHRTPTLSLGLRFVSAVGSSRSVVKLLLLASSNILPSPVLSEKSQCGAI